MKKFSCACIGLVLWLSSIISSYADYPYAGSCPGPNVYVGDMWKFFQCECVSYVAWKINLNATTTKPTFTNSYQYLTWSSAYRWKSIVNYETFAHYSRDAEYMDPGLTAYPFKSYGNGGVFDVRYPIAWWDSHGGTCGSNTSQLECGHVAAVDHIEWNTNGIVQYIDISEYNWSIIHGPDTRRLYPGQNSYPEGFLYFNTDSFLECDLTGLCTPKTGATGGNGGGTSPDFKVPNIWLEDANGNEKTIFAPGESVGIVTQVENIGTDAPEGIYVDYDLSNGLYRDRDPTTVGTDFVHKDDLTSGHTTDQLKHTNAPITPGTYNFTACADSGNDVVESNEDNNCSDEIVFTVVSPPPPVPPDDYGWFIPIMDFILNGN